jgi:hypothetical protein
MSEKTRLSLSVYNGNDNLGARSRRKEKEPAMIVKEKVGFGWATTTASLRLTSSLRPNTFLSSSLYFSQLDNFNQYNVKYGKTNINQPVTPFAYVI